MRTVLDSVTGSCFSPGTPFPPYYNPIFYFPLHVALTRLANGQSLGTFQKQRFFSNRGAFEGYDHHNMKSGGSGDIALYILRLGTMWRWRASYSRRPAYPWESTLHRCCTYWTLDAPHNQSRYGGKVKNSSVLAVWPPISLNKPSRTASKGLSSKLVLGVENWNIRLKCIRLTGVLEAVARDLLIYIC